VYIWQLKLFSVISFGLKYWYLLLPLILVGATAIMLLMYRGNKKDYDLSRQQRITLMTLRFLSVALIAFLLLSPFIKNLKKMVRHPLIIAAWDNSGSVVSTADSVQLAEEILNLKNMLSNELGEDYTLINYSFGQKTEVNGDLDFSEKKSDYSQLITTLLNNHFHEKIGALILTGDGIFNQGKNPVNMLPDINYPVYAIALGDTTEVADARLQAVRVNRTSFSGNRFPVELDAAFSKLQGRPLKVTIREGDKEVAQTVISPQNDSYFSVQEFILDAGEPGLKHYTAEIESSETERNTKNNRLHFVVNVLESRQKILIVSDGPHPDIGAIRNTLEQQKSYEVTVVTEEPYPTNISGYNLVILHQLPTARKSMQHIASTDEKLRIPLLFILGNRTFLPQLNAVSGGAEIQPLAGSSEEAQALIDPSFGIFTLSESLREMIPRFPPLMVPFANYKLEPGISPLLHQRIKNIETNKPLMAAGIINGKKTGFIFGEGIWRWRLNNYFRNQTHEQFNELINQLVQYLALRQNEDNFMIDYEPVYSETDNVLLTAEVYNDAFERLNNEEITIQITNEQGDRFDFTFDVRGNGYHLNAGNLPVGNYHFDASVTIGSQTYTESGKFAVAGVNLENVITRANHRMLYQLAAQSGGGFYTPTQADEIIRQLKESNHLKPVSSFQEAINELLNLRWIFLVLLLLLSVEWFLRKYWGIY
jgi:hypothetical protein